MTEVVLLTDSSKWALIYRGPFDWKTGRTPQMEHSTVQFQRGHAPVQLSASKYPSPQTLCRFSCTNHVIFASSLLEIFHLSREASRNGICVHPPPRNHNVHRRAGNLQDCYNLHHPQILSDDIARHLERGARLVRLFAELGNFFPACRSFNHWSLIVLPDRSASINDLSIMRS